MSKEERAKVAEYVRSNPQLTYSQIALALSIGYSTVTRICAEFSITRTPGRKNTPTFATE